MGIEAAFDAGTAYSVGIEDELMLVDPDTLELGACGPPVLERLHGDERFKLELPTSQLEIVIPPRERSRAGAGSLLDARQSAGRRRARDRPPGRGPGASVRPRPRGAQRAERYEHTLAEYAPVARRQLVCALQVHVGIGDAARALSVYNVARSYLPLIAALAANAPYYEGRDTGLASVRPKLAELLPRQGVPPRSSPGRTSRGACAGAQPRGTSRPRTPGGGSYARTRAMGRSSSACPTHRARSPMRRDRRHDPGPRRVARASGTTGRARSRGRNVANRREPLVGVPARGRGHDGRSADRNPSTDAGVPARAPRYARSDRAASAAAGALTGHDSSRRERGDRTARGGRGPRPRCDPLARRALPRRTAGVDRRHDALPGARGEICAWMLETLVRPAGAVSPRAPVGADAVGDEDLQLALYLLYELHYRGFAGSMSAGSGSRRYSVPRPARVAL